MAVLKRKGAVWFLGYSIRRHVLKWRKLAMFPKPPLACGRVALPGLISTLPHYSKSVSE
jgi:hypothetical protein